MLGSISANLLYDETSTSTAGGILPQLEFIPKLADVLEDDPDKVLQDFQKIRKYSQSDFP